MFQSWEAGGPDMLEQCRDLGFRWLVPRLIPDRVVACGLRDGVALPVGLGVMRPVVQFDHGHDFEGAALADGEIRDLAVELGSDGPLRITGKLAVFGEERRERYLREHMKTGERPP